MIAADAPLLEAVDVQKRYGAVRALNGVDFSVGHGEVVGLVGDNGAGKSTLVKVLCGAHSPDGGTIRVDGEERVFGGPADAAAAGIAVVYQDLALVDTRDIATNVFLGREPGRFFVSRRVMRTEARAALDRLRISLPSMRTLARNLSGGQRQAVAIARALHQGGRLLIMDEPTAALGVGGQREVLRLIDEVRANGTSVVLISHNLEQVFAVCDQIAVLRAGRMAGVRECTETTPEEIVHLITGAGAEALAQEWRRG